MGTTGHFVPPTLIFARKNFKNELLDGAPLGTLGLVQENGWMTGPLFLKWLQHFSKYVKPSAEDKVLLIVDDHASHKNLKVLEYAKSHRIILVSLPSHCTRTHRLQPLDVSFFGPLKIFYDQEISKWLREHPGRVVTQYQISSLLAVAYGEAATVKSATNGFEKCGLFPVNPDIFEEHEFAPSDTTNRPNNSVARDEDGLSQSQRSTENPEDPNSLTPERVPVI
ncbi:uncharacterized protein LOC115884179 [Sitophilus oryzae]|uniref:Uncharacterized protein LOC115884179 n=1 Tax=Sitophilus oryzae TaxID=7048 RepID=A0A6J2Y4D0_SITOR|nr:uncharacterized protein LOC115884179 [Sitophilus oryzae]